MSRIKSRGRLRAPSVPLIACQSVVDVDKGSSFDSGLHLHGFASSVETKFSENELP
jgi:hypothetical protein